MACLFISSNTSIIERVNASKIHKNLLKIRDKIAKDHLKSNQKKIAHKTKIISVARIRVMQNLHQRGLKVTTLLDNFLQQMQLLNSVKGQVNLCKPK